MPPAPRFASRGGIKLDAAIDTFGISVHAQRALDVGSSTGGFTSCLLQKGVGEVVAVDVGRCQFRENLSGDKRVVLMERTDIRNLTLDMVGGSGFGLIVVDVAFVSLTKVLTKLIQELALPLADLILLIKPQFELAHAEVSKGKGVIRDEKLWYKSLCKVAESLSANGANLVDGMVSPITGASGNVEFFFHAVALSSPPLPPFSTADIKNLAHSAKVLNLFE
jgi:23S rRNA (cytidine1920-2'-O)/16S rRNA (cytidine1409-2'-O)-methyltransferase